ncbi:hypothetical protein RhiJN_25124 [Ceratobasidium sp. AG-Ba]|nr:hypothetical protein RhiJN_25124 [Ceratobasidium sp. AG-Ba]
MKDNGTERFAVVVADRRFVLSRAQIEHDSPNYLTSYFLNEDGKSIHDRLEITRDPKIFELVLRYLNGYQILPLDRHLIPFDSTAQRTLADLRADAEFFNLEGLAELCEISDSKPKYVVVTTYSERNHDNEVRPSDGLLTLASQCCLETLNENVFNTASSGMAVLTSTNAHEEQLIIISGWLNHILAEFFCGYYKLAVFRWELQGWKRKQESNLCYHMMFLKLWD